MTELWLLPVDGGRARKPELSMDSLADLRMHPDGRHLAFTRSKGDAVGEVWIMENFLPAAKEPPATAVQRVRK